MWQLATHRPLRLLALVFLAVVLAACSSRGSRSDAARAAANAPSSFDVTLIAEKDDQFDYQQGLPMKTVLLKRGEKNRIKDSHIVALARIAVALGFTSYIENKGVINEIETTTKAATAQ